MGKKSMLSPERRAELVLRLLSKERATRADRAARRDLGADPVPLGERSFSRRASRRWPGVEQTGKQAKEVGWLKSALCERDQVIGELTIANRVLKKLSDSSS